MKSYLEKGDEIRNTRQKPGLKTKELYWGIYYNDSNTNDDNITQYNLFDLNWPMLGALYCINRVCKTEDDFDFFAKEVNMAICHNVWSRCEYEVIVTSWPFFIDEEQLDKIIKEKENNESEDEMFVRRAINVKGIKIDPYQQVMMNWDAFINYLWENRRLLKRYKKYANNSGVSLYRRKYKNYKEGK